MSCFSGVINPKPNFNHEKLDGVDPLMTDPPLTNFTSFTKKEKKKKKEKKVATRDS